MGLPPSAFQKEFHTGSHKAFHKGYRSATITGLKGYSDVLRT